MTDAVVTAASVKKELDADTTITDQSERCALYVRLFGRDGQFNTSEYAELGEEGCSKYDPAQFAGF